MLALGMLLVILSIVLAVTIHFRHFYELLLLGQFLALRKSSAGKLHRLAYTRLYIVFIGAGMMADLVMGRYIAGFWRYNNYHLADYVVLYAFTYPMAGIVMVQSFLTVKQLPLKIKDRPSRSHTLNSRQYVVIIASLSVVLVESFVGGLVSHDQGLMAYAYVLAALIACLVMSFATALNNHGTLIDEVRGQPLRTLLALFTATYFNAFLHEIPNRFAQEWTYINFPLPGWHIFNIPAIILIGWPVLLVFPLSVYYWVRSLHPSF